MSRLRPKRKNLSDITTEMHGVYVEEYVNGARVSAERLGDYLADLEHRVANLEAHLEWQTIRRKGC